MAYEYAIYEKEGHVATITMNRPERLNAVHPPAAEELSAIWDDALADDNTWVIVLTGAGDKAFRPGMISNIPPSTASRKNEPRAALGA